MMAEEQEQSSTVPTVEERAAWAESRHLFWRSRCLEHARTIDRQHMQIYGLVADIRQLEKENQELRQKTQ